MYGYVVIYVSSLYFIFDSSRRFGSQYAPPPSGTFGRPESRWHPRTSGLRESVVAVRRFFSVYLVTPHMDIERVAETKCETGENPLWHPDEAVLYWCDIPNGRLFRYNPRADEYRVVYEVDRAIGGFTIEAEGALLLFESAGRNERWQDGRTETVVESIPGEVDSRFNDVIAAPDGSVFAGTMPTDDRLGRLYHVRADGTDVVVSEGYDIPNGMASTRDRETFYAIESEAHTIYQFDYEPASRTLSTREPALRIPGEPGVPDGMTIDADGDRWLARWDGNALIRYTPEWRERERVEFPARKVASLTFGGPDYRDIYVTTAGGPDRDTEGDGAGALFRVRGDATGREEFRSTIGV